MEQDKRVEIEWGRRFWLTLKRIPLGLEHFLAMFPATILVPITIHEHFGIGAYDAPIIDTSLVLFTSGVGTLIFLLIVPHVLHYFANMHKKGDGQKSTIPPIPPIPTYMGSSFAYIALTQYLIYELAKSGMTYYEAYSYVVWSYLFGGLILIGMSFIFALRRAKSIFEFIMPTAIIGPAISLIGLDLATSAMRNAGFISNGAEPTNVVESEALIYNGVESTTNVLIYFEGARGVFVAAITLAAIILATLVRRRLLKNLAIICGVIVGLVFALFLGTTTSGDTVLNAMWQSLGGAEVAIMPNFYFPLRNFPSPSNIGVLFVAVIPATLVVFAENIGRVTVITKFVDQNKKSDVQDRKLTDQHRDETIFSKNKIPKFRASALLHGVSISASALMGSIPNTLYAENIAVMSTQTSDKSLENQYKKKELDSYKGELDTYVENIHSSYSRTPFFIAASIAIIASFSGHLQQLLLLIPSPVIGGVKLFLFGIISAPGIQLLVDQRVNYKKVSNQLLTASVLISGVSGLQVPLFGIVTLRGMSLGFFVGITMNFVIKAIDYWGKLNDIVELDELFHMCVKEITRQDRKRANDPLWRKALRPLHSWLLRKLGVEHQSEANDDVKLKLAFSTEEGELREYSDPHVTTLRELEKLAYGKINSIGEEGNELQVSMLNQKLSNSKAVKISNEDDKILLNIVTKENQLFIYLAQKIISEENIFAYNMYIDNQINLDHPIEKFDDERFPDGKAFRVLFGGSIPWRKIKKLLRCLVQTHEVKEDGDLTGQQS